MPGEDKVGQCFFHSYLNDTTRFDVVEPVVRNLLPTTECIEVVATYWNVNMNKKRGSRTIHNDIYFHFIDTNYVKWLPNPLI